MTINSYPQLDIISLSETGPMLAKGPAPDYFMGNARVTFLFTIWVVSEKERVRAANEWVSWYVLTVFIS